MAGWTCIVGDQVSAIIAKSRYGVTTTWDGLVRVEKARQHVGTAKHHDSRWGLLPDGYAAEDLYEALPTCIALVEKEELTLGVPSTQFWSPVYGVLTADCILG
jgi:hypothetical protein